MKRFTKVLRQYADFKGRASREEFWMFILFYFIASFAISAIGIGLMLLTEKAGAMLLPCLFMFAFLIPCWAVTVRRLHDVGRSAWLLLVSLIPVIGGILLLVVLISKGNPENNHYGKNPDTTNNNNYNRIRSAAVALMLSAVIWFLSLATFIAFSNGVISNPMLLSLLLPVGLIINGSVLFTKRAFCIEMAWSLIVYSLIWLIMDVFTIRESFSGLSASFNIHLVIEILIILIPIALLLTGIFVIFKKTDRTVPACLLFTGSCIWILSIALKVVQIPVLLIDNSYYLSYIMVITVPVSLMVLARTMLSKNLTFIKAKNELAVPSDSVQAVEPTVQPEAVQVVEPSVQPEAVHADEPSLQPETVQAPVMTPIHKPSTIDDFRKKVVFLREDTDGNNIWIIYKAPSKAVAMVFLSRQRIERPSYYVVVETPEGNFGKDKGGIYQE